MWNFAYDAVYGAGPAVFGLICVRTGYPAAFALTGALILTAVPVALRERKAVASVARGQLAAVRRAENPARDPMPVPQVRTPKRWLSVRSW